MQSAITRDQYDAVLLRWRAGGRHRHFGLVIGVARKENTEELRHHGAHLVVNDLGELVDGPTPQALSRGTAR
jgi:hypothetical protein